MSVVRVRFAPSPTGLLHVGGARTALFNYLFARACGGTYILRIEDTDKERSTEESVQDLLKSLEWLGLSWDEGPGKGGDLGPYFQTERFDLYNDHIDKLLEAGSAYPCFCTPEDLERERADALKNGQTPKYSGRCRDLSKQDIQKKIDSGITPSIRFKIPLDGEIVFEDLIHGETRFDPSLMGDFVIKRSNGYPTYNFTCVVDDALMKITHVLRGDDHLSNTPKQIMLYQALGFELPLFGHLSMILGEDGSRLSKRHGATSVEEFREKGYLPAALTNFLSLLGWSPPDRETSENPELLTMEEIISFFSLDRVSKTAAILNREKLDWMNGVYLRALSDEEIIELVPELKRSPFFKDDADMIYRYISATRDYYHFLGDVIARIDDFSLWVINKELLTPFKTSAHILLAENFLTLTAEKDSLSTNDAGGLFKELSKRTELKGKDLYHPIRYMLSGKEEGPELIHFLTVLPLKEIRSRIQNSLEFLRES